MAGDDAMFLRRAIALAARSRDRGGDPFGAVLVADGVAVFESEDRSVEFSDPTWHAELGVISAYCRATRRIALDGYTLYCSTEPCVMCAGAIKWARISRVVFSVPQPMLQRYTGGSRSRAATPSSSPVDARQRTSGRSSWRKDCGPSRTSCSCPKSSGIAR